MKMVDSYLNEIVRVLKQYEPERIVLFGSRVRGEADEHSDYDLVVIKRTDRPFLDRLRDMVPYLVELARPVDILVYTPEEFDRIGEIGLGWAVRQEAVTLYESSPSRGRPTMAGTSITARASCPTCCPR
jgi:predicted nucleotidyltransferase